MPRIVDSEVAESPVVNAVGLGDGIELRPTSRPLRKWTVAGQGQVWFGCHDSIGFGLGSDLFSSLFLKQIMERGASVQRPVAAATC